MKKPCEMCGMVTEIESTSIVGFYCIDCHSINMEESMGAIRQLEERLASEPGHTPDSAKGQGG